MRKVHLFYRNGEAAVSVRLNITLQYLVVLFYLLPIYDKFQVSASCKISERCEILASVPGLQNIGRCTRAAKYWQVYQGCKILTGVPGL